MLSMIDKKILEDFSQRVRQRYPESKFIAFGSGSRGDAEEVSDLDICVILDNTNSRINKWIRDISWELGFENDRVITAVVFSTDQFERGPMSESALVENILREGIAA